MTSLRHHQRLSFTQGNAQQQLTQRCQPHVTVATWREEKGPQVIQGNSLHSDVGNLGGARYTEVKSTYGVSGYRIQTHMDGVRPTQSPHPPPGVTRPVSRVTHLPDPVPGVARPLVRTPGLCWLGPYGGNDWVPVTSWLGRQECRWVSFPHTCPRDVLFLFGSAWY